MKNEKIKFSFVIPVAPDRDAEILKSIGKLQRKDYEVVIEKGINPSENRNRGMKKAAGEVIVILDDDAILPENFLDKLESFFLNNPDIDVVGGPQLTPETDGFFAKISGLALASKFASFKLSNRYKKGKENLDADESCITSASLACKKKVAKKIVFDKRLFPGEDPKFIDDCKKAGFRIAYTPEIYVWHRRRSSFAKLAKQIFS